MAVLSGDATGGLADLTGVVAVVTGGNSGIGLGIARGLVKAGAAVAVLGSNPERTSMAERELAGLGPADARGYVCDVTSEDAVIDAFESVRRDFGALTAVFASAGVPSGGERFLELSLDGFRRVLAVNLEGTFLAFREGARHMIADGTPGSLVAIASLSAVHGQVRGQAYSASKGGVVALVRSCAAELARHGIRANAVLPGSITTPMSEPFEDTDRFRERVVPRIPLRRPGTTSEMAGVAVYLASKASSYHTGDTLVVDGGYSIF